MTRPSRPDVFAAKPPLPDGSVLHPCFVVADPDGVAATDPESSA